MNTTTKVGLLAGMMVLGVLAISGSASAVVTVSTAMGGGVCNGIVDTGCVCRNDSTNCREGDYCTDWVAHNCIIG